MRSGFVSLIGRPNVGKSTLLNSLINKKIAITSNKPQTTRHIIQGIYHDVDTQIVFVDTPGIHRPKHKLGKYLNQKAYYSIEDVDIILFIVDINEKLGPGDKFVIEKLKEQVKPVILILNKIDKLQKEEILPKIDQYKNLYNFDEIVPLSALKNDNINRLLEVIKKYLTDHIKYYNDEDITNVTKEFIIAEFVREKILEFTEEEVPHSITCIVEAIEEKPIIINIDVLVIVDRDNLKKIIIGKYGKMIKKIGSSARINIENYLNKKVYLKLFVKTIPNWRDREKYLIELGFKTE
jgi:GTPase